MFACMWMSSAAILSKKMGIVPVRHRQKMKKKLQKVTKMSAKMCKNSAILTFRIGKLSEIAYNK